MRKYAKLLLVTVLVLITACTLFACNNNVPPANVGSGGGGGNNSETDTEPGVPVKLTFEIGDDKGTSIFKHMYVDEFSLDYVNCFVNKEYVKNGYTVESRSPIGKLTMDMIDEPSKDLIKQPGNHMIKCTKIVDGKKIKGSFDLHLQERYVNDYSDLKFNLNGGTAGFGSTDADGNVTVKVKTGTTYTWGEFLGQFPVYKKETSDGSDVVYAIKKWKYEKESGETGDFDAAEGHNSITLEPGMIFSAEWTKNTINVDFNLNLPADAEYKPGEAEPSAPAPQTVSVGGIVSRPVVSAFNTLINYEFAGWYQGDNAWNFNSLTGSSDMTLTARWEIRTYSLTFFLMGGEFKAEVPDAPNGKYTVESITDFAYDTNYPFKIQFDGLRYGSKFNEYTSTVSTDLIEQDGNRVVTEEAVINPVTLRDFLTKGRLANGKSYYVLDNWYPDLDFAESDEVILDGNSQVKEDVVLFAKWKDVMGSDKEVKNDYYVNYLFKDGLSVKPDGSVRIDYLTDWSVNELVIPEEIKMPGDTEYRKVTEIKEGSVQNVQTLVTLDLRQAIWLTTIGKLSFAYAPKLKNVYFPGDTVDADGNVTASAGNNMTAIHEQAFRGTLWENSYYDNQRKTDPDNSSGMNGFLIINGILYRYVGGYAYDGHVGDKVVNIDASGLTNVKTIAEKSFMDLDALESVILPASVEKIEKEAFYGCKLLSDITVAETGVQESALNYIDADAFSDTIWRKGNGGSGDDSLKLGRIYYLYTGGTDNTTAIIPEGTKIIAPNAFANGANIKHIYFGDAENRTVLQIEKIGADAFTNTKWITTPTAVVPENKGEGAFISDDGMATVNGMLVNYTGAGKMPVVPDYVVRIVENAFRSFSNNYVTHITITQTRGALVVEDKAFSGCSKVKAITFESQTALDYDKSGNPTKPGNVAISENSFVSFQNGVLGNDMQIYIDGQQYDNFLTDAARNIPVWTMLYENNPENFQKLSVLSVTFNTGKFGTKFIARDSDWSLFVQLKADHSTDGIFVADGDKYVLKDALTVTYNNDAVKTENHSDRESNWKVTGTGAVWYNAIHSSGIRARWDFTVVEAVKGADEFRWGVGHGDKLINGKDADGTLNPPIKVTGLKDIYYTTNSSLDLDGAQLEFRYYSNAAGSERQGIVALDDDNVKIEGYATSIGPHKLIITFNYEGFDTYKIYWEYTVDKNVNRTLVQYNSLSLPLNSKPGEYLKNAYVTLIKNDGSEKRIALNSSQIEITVKNADGSSSNALTTDEIGYHTAQIKYNGGTDGTVFCAEYLYSVVMEADERLFEYERHDVDESGFSDEGFKGYAIVTGINDSFVSGKAIIPFRYGFRHTVDGKEIVDYYKVTGIAPGLFEGNRYLDTVWLPSTVTAVSDKAFKNCVNLKKVYGFEAMDINVVSPLSDNQFDILREDKTLTAGLNIISLKGADRLPQITVPLRVDRKINVDVKDQNQNVLYVSHEKYNCAVTLSPDAFAAYNGKIILPDTEYFRTYATANLQGKTVGFYGEGANEPTADKYFAFGEMTGVNVTAATRQLRYKNYGSPEAPKDENGNYVYDDKTYIVPGVYTFKTDGQADIVGEIIEFETGAFDRIPVGGKLYLPNNFTNSVPPSDSITSKWSAYDIYDIKATDILSPTELFPTSVTSIGKEAFSGCTALNRVEFSAKSELRTLGTHAFAYSGIKYSATEAAGLDLSKTKLTEIATNAFMECGKLEKITFPATVKVINNAAFQNCFLLNTVAFVNGDAGFSGLTYVGDYAFSQCGIISFESKLNSGVARPTAFDGCKKA